MFLIALLPNVIKQLYNVTQSYEYSVLVVMTPAIWNAFSCLSRECLRSLHVLVPPSDLYVPVRSLASQYRIAHVSTPLQSTMVLRFFDRRRKTSCVEICTPQTIFLRTQLSLASFAF